MVYTRGSYKVDCSNDLAGSTIFKKLKVIFTENVKSNHKVPIHTIRKIRHFMTNETNTRNLTLAQLLWEKVFLGKVHLLCKFTVKGLIIYFQLLIYDIDHLSSSKKLKCFP